VETNVVANIFPQKSIILFLLLFFFVSIISNDNNVANETLLAARKGSDSVFCVFLVGCGCCALGLRFLWVYLVGFLCAHCGLVWGSLCF
jgi:hypothetical protein